MGGWRFLDDFLGVEKRGGYNATGKTVFSSFLVLEASLRKNSVIPRSALRVMIYVQEDFISN